MNLPLQIDWTPETFLWFYGIFLIALLLFTIFRNINFRQSFANGLQENRQWNDTEVAFLAGGPKRCADSFLLRLVLEEKLKFKYGSWESDYLIAQVPSLVTGCPAKKQIFEEIANSRKRGIQAQKFHQHCEPLLTKVEETLAQKGLRPTKRERFTALLKLRLPILVFILIGALPLALNFFSDWDFIINLLLMIFGSLLLILASHLSILTRKGKQVLRKAHKLNRDLPIATPEIAASQFGLFGWTAIRETPFANQLDTRFRVFLIHRTRKEAGTHSGGTAGCGGGGCSSGCGGGGCGGG